MRYAYTYFVFLFASGFVYSQTNAYDITVPPENGYRYHAEVLNGDTIPVVDLNEVAVYTNFIFKNRRHVEQWTRIKFNVKTTYPYAILAAAKLKEYDRALAQIHDEKTRKTFIKLCEKDLRKQFEGELTNLTVSQGKMLMKLIDRETGKTTYDIVKQMRGNFQANMWQAVAVVFGHNMKSTYDPVEDIMIERAIKLVEAGQF
ncbi:MAG: DUF4294 domain-containing protein [Bacteroidetes bacterium]|nr:DUF4294 domain-containing protein [Bacteroidota bacterium]